MKKNQLHAALLAASLALGMSQCVMAQDQQAPVAELAKPGASSAQPLQNSGEVEGVATQVTPETGPASMTSSQPAVVPESQPTASDATTANASSAVSSVEARESAIEPGADTVQSPVVMTKSPENRGIGSGAGGAVTGGGTLFSVMLALVAVVVLIFMTAWVIKRFSGLSPINNRQIKVVATLPVGTRERVVLVEVGGQQLLLGVTAQQINTLHTFDEPVVISDKPASSEFAQRLQSMLSKGNAE